MDKYKCWDCEKIRYDLNFDEETKKKCPKSSDGYLLFICNDCKDNDDY